MAFEVPQVIPVCSMFRNHYSVQSNQLKGFSVGTAICLRNLIHCLTFSPGQSSGQVKSLLFHFKPVFFCAEGVEQFSAYTKGSDSNICWAPLAPALQGSDSHSPGSASCQELDGGVGTGCWQLVTARDQRWLSKFCFLGVPLLFHHNWPSTHVQYGSKCKPELPV